MRQLVPYKMHTPVKLKGTVLRHIFVSLALYAICFASFASTGPGGETTTENTPAVNTADYITQLTADQINAYYSRRHKLDGFNGCVLISKDGKPIYTGSFGYGNYSKKDTLTGQSPFQLASVTKTFTSAAILQLVSQGQLSLDDTLQKFFPDFPYPGITIKLLLSHRTGLSDYVYWPQEFVGKDVSYLTNQSMLDLIITKKPPLRALPNRIFLYCNTNYALLALVIEKVSGLCYKDYMQQNIFGPLQMNNTFVACIEDTANNCGATCYEAHRWKEWQLGFPDGVVGDKGIYSSVEDMLKWDNALKEGKIVAPEWLEEAYKPQSHDRYSFAKDRTHNYGLGWRMTKQRDGSYLIYHNGNWHGCNNVFARNLRDGYTIIVLGNKSNEANYLTQPVWDILAKMRNLQNIAASVDQ
jgi:CubicO group peptidase (beta-lactamase class C family)